MSSRSSENENQREGGRSNNAGERRSWMRADRMLNGYAGANYRSASASGYYLSIAQLQAVAQHNLYAQHHLLSHYSQSLLSPWRHHHHHQGFRRSPRYYHNDDRPMWRSGQSPTGSSDRQRWHENWRSSSPDLGLNGTSLISKQSEEGTSDQPSEHTARIGRKIRSVVACDTSETDCEERGNSTVLSEMTSQNRKVPDGAQGGPIEVGSSSSDSQLISSESVHYQERCQSLPEMPTGICEMVSNLIASTCETDRGSAGGDGEGDNDKEMIPESNTRCQATTENPNSNSSNNEQHDWFSQEEQQHIVNMLIEVDLRHEQQLSKYRDQINESLKDRNYDNKPSPKSATPELPTQMSPTSDLYYDDASDSSSSDDGIVIILPPAYTVPEYIFPLEETNQDSSTTAPTTTTINIEHPPVEEKMMHKDWGKYCSGWGKKTTDSNQEEEHSKSISEPSLRSNFKPSNESINVAYSNDLKRLLGICSSCPSRDFQTPYYEDLTLDDKIEVQMAGMAIASPTYGSDVNISTGSFQSEFQASCPQQCMTLKNSKPELTASICETQNNSLKGFVIAKSQQTNAEDHQAVHNAATHDLKTKTDDNNHVSTSDIFRPSPKSPENLADVNTTSEHKETSKKGSTTNIMELLLMGISQKDHKASNVSVSKAHSEESFSNVPTKSSLTEQKMPTERKQKESVDNVVVVPSCSKSKVSCVAKKCVKYGDKETGVKKRPMSPKRTTSLENMATQNTMEFPKSKNKKNKKNKKKRQISDANNEGAVHNDIVAKEAPKSNPAHMPKISNARKVSEGEIGNSRGQNTTKKAPKGNRLESKNPNAKAMLRRDETEQSILPNEVQNKGASSSQAPRKAPQRKYKCEQSATQLVAENNKFKSGDEPSGETKQNQCNKENEKRKPFPKSRMFTPKQKMDNCKKSTEDDQLQTPSNLKHSKFSGQRVANTQPNAEKQTKNSARVEKEKTSVVKAVPVTSQSTIQESKRPSFPSETRESKMADQLIVKPPERLNKTNKWEIEMPAQIKKCSEGVGKDSGMCVPLPQKTSSDVPNVDKLDMRTILQENPSVEIINGENPSRQKFKIPKGGFGTRVISASRTNH